jgi:hypothetical protein
MKITKNNSNNDKKHVYEEDFFHHKNNDDNNGLNDVIGSMKSMSNMNSTKSRNEWNVLAKNTDNNMDEDPIAIENDEMNNQDDFYQPKFDKMDTDELIQNLLGVNVTLEAPIHNNNEDSWNTQGVNLQ